MTWYIRTRGRLVETKLQKPNFRVILFVLLLVCWGSFLCYYGGGLLYASGTDQRNASLVYETIEIDTSALPENPTIEDWYPLATQILKSKNWQLNPNLTSVETSNIPCDSEPKLDEITFNFADVYFKGIFPCRKRAHIWLNRINNTASIDIYYEMMEWQYASLDLTQLEIGLDEAFKIADDYQGKTFRDSVNNECQMGFWIKPNAIWEISYKAKGQRWEDWEIWVDAISGEAKRHQLPTLSK